MHFDYSPEQQSIRQEALALARQLDARDIAQADRESRFDRVAWKRLADASFLHGFVPKEQGGRGWDTVSKVAALEAFGYGCRDNGLALALTSLVWTIITPIIAFGNEDQKRRYLPRLLTGECLAADGITEENAGSDALSMTTSAEKVEGGYRLNGEKTHIGLAPVADLILLYAKSDPTAGAWGISAFLVEGDSTGIQKSDNQERMGLRTLPSGSIAFTNCFVPDDCRLGDEGAGMSLFNDSTEYERGFILSAQVGAMQRQLETCIDYTKKRQQFGKPISQFQSVSNRIADMKVRLETCRLHLYRAAWLKDQGRSAGLEASITKLCISESFAASSLDAIRLHGAKGYLSEYEVERDLRDATGGLIYAGTSDIQRNLIARLCGL